MNRLRILSLAFLIFIFVFSACNKSKDATVKNSPTKNEQKIDDNKNLNENQNNENNVANLQPVQGGEVIVLTNETFRQRVFDYKTNTDWNYLGDKPCIIDFYADWCRPCKMIEPILDEIAKEYNGKLYVYRVNVDENREVASVFGIRSIPSVLFVPMNDKPQMAVGAHPKDFYLQAIKEVLKVQ